MHTTEKTMADTKTKRTPKSATKKKPTKDNTTTIVKIRKPRKGSPSEKIITLNAVTAQTPAEIAEQLNVSIPAVVQCLKRYGLDYNTVQSFKKNRAEIFAGLQQQVAATLTPADLKKASVRDRTILLGTIYDKERLETGQATQINRSYEVTGTLKELVDLVAGRAKVEGEGGVAGDNR